MVSYTLLNGAFIYNNIAYSALTSPITKNSKVARADGILPFYFCVFNNFDQAITVGFVDKCGGDAAAWRTVAIIYAIIGLVNMISALSVRASEELNEGESKE